MNGNNRTGMWVGIVIVVLIIIGLVWYFMSKNSSDDTSMATSTGTTFTDTANPSAANTTSGSGTMADNASVSVNNSKKSSTVAAIAESIAGASQFASLFESTGVAAQVTGKGPYTVFVPTNGAISQLPAGTITGMTAAQKKRLIQYHVISGRAVDSDAVAAGSVQALSGDMLNFTYGNTKIPMVNSAIFVTQYNASNGVVYLIDNVLLPPNKTQ